MIIRYDEWNCRWEITNTPLSVRSDLVLTSPHSALVLAAIACEKDEQVKVQTVLQ